MTKRILICMVLAIGFAIAFQPVFSPTDVQATQKADKNERGKKLYNQHCASCHGIDGKGAGAVAGALKTPVPDLTTIAKREGKFDSVKVGQNISGEIGVTAHGEKDMPVWGYIFRHKENKTVADINVYALTKYVESMQEK